MRSKERSGSLTAMLDVLCCAFGGVMILSVVIAVQIGENRRIQLHSYMVLEGRIELSSSTAISDDLAANTLRHSPMSVLIRNKQANTEVLFNSKVHFMRDQPENSTYFTPTATGNELYFSLTIGNVEPGEYEIEFFLNPRRARAFHRRLPRDTKVTYELNVRHSGGEEFKSADGLWFPPQLLDQSSLGPTSPQATSVTSGQFPVKIKALDEDNRLLHLPWDVNGKNSATITHYPQ